MSLHWSKRSYGSDISELKPKSLSNPSTWARYESLLKLLCVLPSMVIPMPRTSLHQSATLTRNNQGDMMSASYTHFLFPTIAHIVARHHREMHCLAVPPNRYYKKQFFPTKRNDRGLFLLYISAFAFSLLLENTYIVFKWISSTFSMVSGSVFSRLWDRSLSTRTKKIQTRTRVFVLVIWCSVF